MPLSALPPVGQYGGYGMQMPYMPTPQAAALLVPPPPDPEPRTGAHIIGMPQGALPVKRVGSPAMRVVDQEEGSSDDAAAQLPQDARRNVVCRPCADAFLFFYRDAELTQFRLSPAKSAITIGRHNDVAVQVSRTEQSVSRWHATIIPTSLGVTDGSNATKYVFKDISTYGSFVNGRKVVEQELLDGDKIHLGGMEEGVFFLRPNTCERPAFEGLVYKHSPAFHKQWQPRWMVLGRECILYFKKKDDPLPVGCIDLCGILLTDTKKPKNSFAIITRGRTYHLYTKTDKEKLAWLSAIDKAISSAHPNPCLPAKPPTAM